MKKTKLLATILAAVMIIMTLSAGMLAFATDSISTYAGTTPNDGSPNGVFSIENDPAVTGASIIGQQYDLYRIFNATVDEDGSVSYTIDVKYVDFFSGTLVNGDGVSVDFTSATELTIDALALQYVRSFDSSEIRTIDDLVVDFMAYIEANGLTESATTAAAALKSDGSGVENALSSVYYGYYLVLTKSDPSETQAASAGNLVTIVEEFKTISLKITQPSIDKEIYHNELDTWGSVGDNQIGDTVEFKITATLPHTFKGYDSYEYIVTDTLSAGVTFNDDVKFFVDADFTTELDSAYYTALTEDGAIFSYSFDVMAIDADLGYDYIYIYYTGTLNSDAVVSSDKETNEVTLEYSNNPYDADSRGKDSDIVYEYTFDLDVLKVGEDGVTPLAGATFALYEVDYGNETQIALIYDDVNDVYYTDASATASETEGVIVTNDTGVFNIKGLDDATEYVIKEIDAPAGYNAISPMYFTISAAYTTDGSAITTLVTNNTHISATTDGLSTTIVNTSGATLPETGGIGTTIFTIVGISMMGVAVLFLVAKSRKKLTSNFLDN